MFQDLDSTLKLLLTAAAAPADLRAAEISFQTPDKNYAPPVPAVNLFLFHLQENLELRRVAPIRELSADKSTYTIRPEPERFDCTYLVTAWSKKDNELKVEEEHRLLGLTFGWLNRFTTIPNSSLIGVLADPRYPLPTMVAQMKPNDSAGLFWSALGIAPRPTFTLTVTIELRLSDRVEEGDTVRTFDIGEAMFDAPRLAGRVLDAAGAAVAGARVVVAGTGTEITTDLRGAFEFSALAFGAHTLRVFAGDDADPVTRSVEYRPDSQLHNIQLPGL